MTDSTSSADHHNEYGDDFVAGLEWIWGEDFLSPGGEDEVARILHGLDIGCGIGGVDILLIKHYGAGRVLAIDLAVIGFSDIESEDRNAWYREEARRELAAVSGENYARLIKHIGESAAAQRLRSSNAKLAAVEQGQLRPGHLRARRPV